jgi:hypothetical protein
MSNKIKELIDKSGKTRYYISKTAKIPIKTLDNWYYDKNIPSYTLLRLLLAISNSPAELEKNIRYLLED